MLNKAVRLDLLKRFKDLLGDCWNVDLLVVIKKDKEITYQNLQGFKNPVVQTLLQSSVFKTHFFNSFRPLFNATTFSSKEGQFLPWKQTGLNLFVVPVSSKKKSDKVFLAVAGFAPEKKNSQFQQALSYIGMSNKDFEEYSSLLKKLNASDKVYIKKILHIIAEELPVILSSSRKQGSLEQDKADHLTYGVMKGSSPAMQYIFNVLKKIKNYDDCVLIEGEPGTGKRLLAKTIHLESLRSQKSFHIQNFSIFRGRYLESTLFNYHKSSSRAFNHKKYLAKKLQGGTLFLNEVGHTSLEFQKRLLNFLQSSTLFNTGELKDKKYNIRIISSTSQDLRELVKKGEFIDSLYFAISAMSIKIPPLRFRKIDIPLLADYFLNRENPENRLGFSNTTLKLLCNYPWSGNIQELESEIKKIVSLKRKDQHIFTEKDLSPQIKNFSYELHDLLKNASSNQKQSLKDTLRSIEKHILLEHLRKNNWNKTKAAQALRTSRTSLIFKAKEYGLLKEGA